MTFIEITKVALVINKTMKSLVVGFAVVVALLLTGTVRGQQPGNQSSLSAL